MAHADVVPRAMLPVALERMTDEPVIVLEGARAVGKSTLLRVIAERRRGPVIDLDNLETRAAVSAPGFSD